jgi:hypothetical protein
MLLIAEIAMFVFGIITLATGKFTLTRGRVVQGTSARIVGVILLMPLVLGFGGGFVISFIKVAQAGAQGQEVDAEQLKKDLETPLLILNAVVTIGSFLLVVVISLVNARPPEPKRRPFDDFDRTEEEEDEPRYRRPRPKDDRFQGPSSGEDQPP